MIQLIEAKECGYSDELIEFVTSVLQEETKSLFYEKNFVLEDGILKVVHEGKVLEV